MTLPVSIRLATRNDIAAIMTLLRCKAEFDGSPDSLKATPELVDRNLFGETPLGEVLLAERDGRVIGFATYFFTYSSFLAQPGVWLDDLYINEDQRGTGAGTALMAEMARVAQERGCGRLEWIVSATNDRAIAFYKGHGAKIKDDTRLCRADQGAIAGLADLCRRPAA